MKTSKGRIRAMLCAAGLTIAGFATGCQVEIGGQTLPSPYYQFDDVQYYAPGPEFKLSNEAAALRSRAAETIAPGIGRNDLPPGEILR
ncbi:MAG: hypothetical protein MPJ50_10985 [Pirellulales bacterium]|nr:hypothetical protein [Pirellulales bacterium]